MNGWEEEEEDKRGRKEQPKRESWITFPRVSARHFNSVQFSSVQFSAYRSDPIKSCTYIYIYIYTYLTSDSIPIRSQPLPSPPSFSSFSSSSLYPLPRPSNKQHTRNPSAPHYLPLLLLMAYKNPQTPSPLPKKSPAFIKSQTQQPRSVMLTSSQTKSTHLK